MKHITTDNQLSASALRNLPSSSPLFLLCPPLHPLFSLMTVAESCPYLEEGREEGREAGGWDRKEEGGAREEEEERQHLVLPPPLRNHPPCFLPRELRTQLRNNRDGQIV